MSLQLTPAWYHKHKTKWPCAAGVWDKLRDWTETHVPALVTPTWPTTKMISLFCFQPTAHMSSMGYQLPTNRKTEQLPTSPATEQQQHATLKQWCSVTGQFASFIFWLTGEPFRTGKAVAHTRWWARVSCQMWVTVLSWLALLIWLSDGTWSLHIPVLPPGNYKATCTFPCHDLEPFYDPPLHRRIIMAFGLANFVGLQLHLLLHLWHLSPQKQIHLLMWSRNNKQLGDFEQLDKIKN